MKSQEPALAADQPQQVLTDHFPPAESPYNVTVKFDRSTGEIMFEFHVPGEDFQIEGSPRGALLGKPCKKS